MKIAEKKIAIIFPLIIIAAALIAYYNSFYCAWHLDDFHAIVDYDYNSINLWQLILLRKQRALGFITFYFNHKLCDYNLFGWHIVNFVIHVINSLLIYAVACRLFIQTEILNTHPQKKLFGYISALVIAIIFAVNPIQTSAVTYIVQRIELLSAMFIFLSFYLFLLFISAKKISSKWIYCGCGLVCIALGAITKETIVVAPVLMGAYIVIV